MVHFTPRCLFLFVDKWEGLLSCFPSWQIHFYHIQKVYKIFVCSLCYCHLNKFICQSKCSFSRSFKIYVGTESICDQGYSFYSIFLSDCSGKDLRDTLNKTKMGILRWKYKGFLKVELTKHNFVLKKVLGPAGWGDLRSCED